MEIRDVLKKRRIELGLSMLDVANAVGVSEATISRWESGNISNLKRENICRLSKALGVSPMVLMGWGEEAERAASESDALDEENLKLFRELPPDKKRQVLDFLRFLTSSGDND